jgi:transcriptional regulator with XRE-family HTH domain
MESHMVVSPEQIRAARALLRLGQDELARRAGVSAITVRRAETGSAGVSPGALDGLRRALETAGVDFIERGVRRREAVRPDKEERYRAMMEIAKRSAERQARLPRITEDDLYDENGLPA